MPDRQCPHAGGDETDRRGLGHRRHGDVARMHRDRGDHQECQCARDMLHTTLLQKESMQSPLNPLPLQCTDAPPAQSVQAGRADGVGFEPTLGF